MLKFFKTKLTPPEEAPARITYQSKVKCSEGFYEGCEGTVVEMRFGTAQEYRSNTSGSGYWSKYATTEYRVRLNDGNEPWIASGDLVVVPAGKNNGPL